MRAIKPLPPTRCPVCKGLKTIAKKRYKDYDANHEGVWLHTHTYEGVTYMNPDALTVAELNELTEVTDGGQPASKKDQ